MAEEEDESCLVLRVLTREGREGIFRVERGRRKGRRIEEKKRKKDTHDSD